MKRPSRSAAATVLVLLAVCPLACDDGDDRGDPVGADIHGRWYGEYYVEGGGARTELVADIDQDGEAVVLRTSLRGPRARTFTGTIDAEGNMRLTDASDGEIWTTHHTKATAETIRLADFVSKPTPENPFPSRRFIVLHR